MLINVGRYGFQFSWLPLLITLVVFCILIKLCFWQLSRAEAKNQRLQHIAQLQAQGEQSITLIKQLPSELDKTGIQLGMTGSFITDQFWFLDNRVFERRVGYDVLAAFRSNEMEELVLINLGWVPAKPTRQELPEFTLPQGQVLVTGFVRDGELSGFQLAHNQPQTQTWPKRIQNIDIEQHSQELNRELVPWIVYLQEAQFGAVPHYQPVVMPPEKHRAYAMQWGGLALASIIVFLYASRINMQSPLTRRSKIEQ